MMMMMRATSLAAATVFLFWSAHAEDILLASQIRSIVDRPEYLGCKWGIQAQMTNTSIEDGGLIYSNPGASLFSVPASNGKIPTTFAAWLSLGPEYTFETSIGMSVSDDGTRANLTLCGSNDPSMTSVQLEAAAQAAVTSQPLLAAAASVTVRVDNRRGSDATFPGSWEWGDLQYYYGAPPASVILDGNVVAVQIEADEEDGGEDGLAVVTLPDPGSEQCFTVVNKVRTTAPGSSTSVAGSFEVRSGSFSLVLTGTVASSSSSYGSFDMSSDNGNNSSSSSSTSSTSASTSTSTSTSPVVLTVSCRDPLRRAGDALVSFLQDAGITTAKAAGDNDNGDELGGGFVVTNAPECDGNVVGRPQTVPAAAAATITSERLEILLNHTLLESDNTYVFHNLENFDNVLMYMFFFFLFSLKRVWLSSVFERESEDR
jgi:D-alanyl-D-alanine carboxypeptidase